MLIFPFARRPHPVLWIAGGRAVRLDPAWTREGVRARRSIDMGGLFAEETRAPGTPSAFPGTPSAFPDRDDPGGLSSSEDEFEAETGISTESYGETHDDDARSARSDPAWGWAPRVVTANLPPAAVRHRLESLPDLDAADGAAWAAERCARFAAERAGDIGAWCHVPGAAPRLLLGAAPVAVVDGCRRALEARGLVPASLVSVLPLLGYVLAPDGPHGAYRVRLGGLGHIRDLGEARYAGGVLTGLDDAPAPDETSSWAGQAGHSPSATPDARDRAADVAPEPVIVVPIGAPLLPAVDGPGADDTRPALRAAPAYALALSDRHPDLPRLNFLDARARERARVALDRREASRVLAVLVGGALLVASVVGIRLSRAETAAQAARARVDASRPGLLALERAETAAQALPVPGAGLAPLADDVGRRVPAGLALTHLGLTRSADGTILVDVRGRADGDALVPAYLDALAAAPSFVTPRLRAVTRPRPGAPYAFALDLRVRASTPPLPPGAAPPLPAPPDDP